MQYLRLTVDYMHALQIMQEVVTEWQVNNMSIGVVQVTDLGKAWPSEVEETAPTPENLIVEVIGNPDEEDHVPSSFAGNVNVEEATWIKGYAEKASMECFCLLIHMPGTK